MCNLSISGVIKITSPILRENMGIKHSIIMFNKTKIFMKSLKLNLFFVVNPNCCLLTGRYDFSTFSQAKVARIITPSVAFTPAAQAKSSDD
jgi:hypothetical protein